MSLSPRLHAIAQLIPSGSRVVDVGCDHGHLAVWLRQQGKSPFVIATDVAAQPLEAARRSADNAGVTTGIDFRLADGLEAVRPDEADIVVMAGMGGETMFGILAKALWLTEGDHRLLLQPQSKVPELMCFLAANGYQVQNQHVVADNGRLYTILEATAGQMEYPQGGKRYLTQTLIERGDPLLEAYLTEQIITLSRVAEGLERAGDKEKLAEATAALYELETWRGEKRS